MHADEIRLNELSGRVGCAFTVLNTLGAGFLEMKALWRTNWAGLGWSSEAVRSSMLGSWPVS